MQTASFEGLIKAIFYVLVFYYVFKILAKLFLPVLVKKVVQKAEQNFQQQYQHHQNPQNTNQSVPGTSKAARPGSTKNIGEYVDYEEID